MLQSLYIAATGLQAYKKSTDVISTNINNVSNPDYNRKDPIIVDLPKGGVALNSIRRAFNKYLFLQYIKNSSSLKDLEIEQFYLNNVEQVFDDIKGLGLLDNLGKFFDAWQDVANDPDDITNRENLVLTTDLLLDKSKQAYETLIDNQAEIWDNIKNNVRILNDKLKNLAEINVKLNSSPNDPSLLDTRDKLIKEISELINVNVTLDDKTGKVYLTTTKGIPLVESGKAFLFYTDENNKVKDFTNARYVYNFMDNINLIKGGKLGGLAKSYLKIEEYKKNFSSFITDLIEKVNKVFAYDSNGNAPYALNSTDKGIPYFSSAYPITFESLDVDKDYKIGKFDLDDKSVVYDSNGKLSVSISVANDGLYKFETYLDSNKHIVLSFTKPDGTSYTYTDTNSDENGDGKISLKEFINVIHKAIPSDSSSPSVTLKDSNGNDLDLNLSDFLNIDYKYYNGEYRLTIANKKANSSMFINDTLTVYQTGGYAFDYYTMKNISVNEVIKKDPTKICIAKNPPDNSGDNTYAWKVVDLRDEIITNYKNFTGKIAGEKSFIDASYSSQKELFNSIEERYKNETGVDLDQELIKLTEMQRAYQASARVITVANEILDILLNLGKV